MGIRDVNGVFVLDCSFVFRVSLSLLMVLILTFIGKIFLVGGELAEMHVFRKRTGPTSGESIGSFKTNGLC